MREIKFRAWDKEDKYMFDVKQINTGVNIGDFAKFTIWEENEGDNRADGNYLVEHNGDTIELMQFTGLYDKNGKEIWEGDIVKHRKLNRPNDSTMYGLTESFMNSPREVKFEGCGFIPIVGWIDDAIKDMEWEVIGNIWENPEMLEK